MRAVLDCTFVGVFCEKLAKIDLLFPVSAFDSSRVSFQRFKCFVLAKITLPYHGGLKIRSYRLKSVGRSQGITLGFSGWDVWAENYQLNSSALATLNQENFGPRTSLLRDFGLSPCNLPSCNYRLISLDQIRKSQQEFSSWADLSGLCKPGANWIGEDQYASDIRF